MNCPHHKNGPLNAAGAFCYCKQGKTAYNNYSMDAAGVLSFITEVQGQIDGIL